jgi:nucleoside-diphosphate-sugar epimerase
MKILITGGLGFIGHYLVRNLESQGHQIIITDTKTTYGLISQDHMQHLISQRQEQIATDRIYSIDVVDGAGIDWLIKAHRPDVVVHLASFPRQQVVNAAPATASQVMIQGLLNLLESSVKHNVSRFVYVSSSMVYGDFANAVASESYNCNPHGQYAVMKLAGEWLVRDYTARTGLAHVIVRPSAVYGPRDILDRVVSKFLRAALSNQILLVKGKDQLLDFTFVEDAVQGIASAVLESAATNNTYNICRGQPRTLLEAAELATTIGQGGQVSCQAPDPAFPCRGTLDIAQAQRDLSFNPQIDIEQGFKIYSDWLKQEYTKV